MRRLFPRTIQAMGPLPESILWRWLAFLAVGLGVVFAETSHAGPNHLASQPSRASIEGKNPNSRRRLVALPFPGSGIPIAPSGSNSSVSTKRPSSKPASAKPENPWSVSLGAEHFAGFYESSEPTSELSVSADYKTPGGQTVTFGHSVTKLYLKTPGESEWQVNDAALGVSGTLSKDWFAGIAVKGSLGATLPLSEQSQRVDEMTRLSAGIKLSRSWWNDKFTLGLAPSGRYHVNRFTTTPTYEGSGGGRPLTQSSLKAKASASYQLSERWSTGAYGSVQQVFYEKVDYQNSESTLGLINPPTHFYDWGASLDFEPSKRWSFSLGYSHSQKLENPWGVEVLVFDEQVSQWSIGATFKF
ncbi:MAG: hypothetical protein IT288_18150 [Bdellovibrionales bacterium]|nr:hypothetical protein [Bdellovibrionales bacterium]